jgi:DNA primase
LPRQSESTLAAIKQAIDIVALVGDYLPLHRNGTKYKALCPFHDDHNPSMEVNPDRQSFKCWACGAGGDIFDFVQSYERVEFSEALRMLAERAGISLSDANERDRERSGASRGGLSRAELLAASAWAESRFVEEYGRSAEARAYAASRGISAASVERFRLGFAPDRRDWLQSQARAAGVSLASLEAAGLVARNAETQLTHDRFRGRLMFPIRDMPGRAIAFGGRILPETEKKWTDAGRHVAKYLNSPETPLFQKRKQLYAADLARHEARRTGWVAVMEGYTDVIAAHQAGLENVVATLGTALGDEHVTLLRRLAETVVLVFDGDEAGQKAADRSLEFFLSHELEMRVLCLPGGLDPCDFLMSEGADAFRRLMDSAVDPLSFAIDRATSRFDLDSPEGTRLAAESVLEVLARVPEKHRNGLEFKVAKALDTLSHQLRIPARQLSTVLRRFRTDHARVARRAPAPHEPAAEVSTRTARPMEVRTTTESRPTVQQRIELDRVDRELVELALNEPSLVPILRSRVPADLLVEPSLRAILQACYELDAEGQAASFERLSLRLDDPAVRSLAAGLLLPLDPAPLAAGTRPAPPEVRLQGVLQGLALREWQQRVRDLEAAKAELDPSTSPDDYQALQREYFRVWSQRPRTAR